MILADDNHRHAARADGESTEITTTEGQEVGFVCRVSREPRARLSVTAIVVPNKKGRLSRSGPLSTRRWNVRYGMTFIRTTDTLLNVSVMVLFANPAML